jgi:autotransporter-associated beta strand protein
VFAINRSDAFTFGGVISGTGSFQQLGTGTTILSAANSYSGRTTISAGVLNVSADHNLGAASGGLTFNGGTLQFGSAFNLASTRTTTLNGGGGAFDTNGFNTSISQGITGIGGLTKTGTGTLTLSGSNSYSGGTVVNDTPRDRSARAAIPKLQYSSADRGAARVGVCSAKGQCSQTYLCELKGTGAIC